MSLSFKEMEELLSRFAQIHSARRDTFQSRIKQWQKMGFPDGISVGRGVRAEYRATQIYQLALMIELLTLGLTPERAQTVIQNSWPEMQRAIGMATNAISAEIEEKSYLIIQMDALENLRSGKPKSKTYTSISFFLDQTIEMVSSRAKELPASPIWGSSKDGSFSDTQSYVRCSLLRSIIIELDQLLKRIWAIMLEMDYSPDVLSEVSEWQSVSKSDENSAAHFNQHLIEYISETKRKKDYSAFARQSLNSK